MGDKATMGCDILNELKLNTREEAIVFLKSLWGENPQLCPIFNGKLAFFHKKAKKSNCDWICTSCGKRYDTIKILKSLPDE